MSDIKFTPGPWEAVGGCMNAIAPMGSKLAIAECWYRGDWDNTRANARLIAAAPDMYEALGDLIECIDPDTGNGFISKVEWHNARTAIAKAEGRS